MPKLESAVEDYFVKRVKETGGAVRKVKWVSRRGAPDRLAGWQARGIHCYVELKEEEQPWGLQDHQAREHQWMIACGMRVAILCNRTAVDAFIREMTGQ